MRLEGKRAIITGAGSGIGRAIALGFSAEGALVVSADINFSTAQRTAADIKSSRGTAIAVEVDVSERSQVESMVQATVDAFGRIDVLVCVAGIASVCHFLDLPEEWWDDVINVNLKGHFLCGQAAAREMVKTGGGAIVNITSQVAEVAQPLSAHGQGLSLR